MGVASLILGIVSLVIAVFFPAIGYIGALVGIVGVILGAMARKNAPSGVATAGMVMSIIGTALALLLFLACAACAGAIASL